MESLFVHARTAKCCSNADGERQEPAKVYENCGGYLSEEMGILEPDVIITQGNNAHPMAEEYVFNTDTIEITGIEGIGPGHNVAHVATLRYNSRPVFWLRSYHPGARWRYYSQAGDKIALESNCVGAKRILCVMGKR